MERTETIKEKIENLEDEMREIALAIRCNVAKMQRYKQQSRIQEASFCLQKIKMLEKKLNRTQRRLSSIDRSKSEDVEEKETQEDLEEKETKQKKEDKNLKKKIQSKTEEPLKMEENVNEPSGKVDKVEKEQVSVSLDPET